MGWRDTIRKDDTATTPVSSWRDTIRKEEPIATPPSQLESAARSVAQGATLGFEDELAGVGGAIGSRLGGMGVGQVESTHPDVQARVQALAPPEKSLGELYTQSREEERGLNKAAEEANPWTYGGGSLVGGIANPISKVGSTLKGAAGLGAAYGLGSGKADLTKGELASSGVETGLGALGGAAGYGVGKAIPKLASGAGSVKDYIKNKMGYKVGSFLTGIPEKEIQTYATKTDEINKMISDSGGNVSAAADAVREKLQTGLRNTRSKLSGQISQVLNDAPPQKTIDVSPVLNNLQVSKAKLNPNLQSEAVSEIDDLIKKISSEADENGNVNIKSLQDIKNFLMENAKSSYLKDGKIFYTGKQSARAAKDAATSTLKILNPLSPEIEGANRQLQKLHIIEENLNKNLIAPGKPDSALMAVGSGGNQRNINLMNQLGKITGQNPVEEAEKLAAVSRFANPSWTPADTTGKSAFRLGASALIGNAIAGPVGGALAAGTTSPAVVKSGINVANQIGKIMSQAGGSQVFGKFAPIIEAAAKRGPEALAVTGSMLGSDPEFQKLLKGNAVQ